MADFTHDQARRAIDGGLAFRRQCAARPIAIAVVDSGGHLVAAAREDEVGFLRTELAINKAWSCMAYGRSTGAMQKRIAGHDHWMMAATGMVAGHRLIASPGGVVALDQYGRRVGAVGVANATNDEEIAIQAIEAAGLVADTDTPE
ncbi:MAG: heme-binding protein [Alphaproteobacteria bacterium]